MPTIRDQRRYHGPNGPDNYITDNPSITLTRDVNDRITLITLLTVNGVTLTKTITRAVGGLITAVGTWVRP